MKLKIREKAFLKSESRASVTLKLQFLALAIYQWQRLGLSKYATMKKCEKLLYVTEVLVSEFKNAFSGIFNFTVGILLVNQN